MINQTQINGERFRAELDQSSVVIPEGCRIQQPGERLDARQCRWNWQTDEVLASGGVRVERESNNQITEAQTLSGSVGDEGALTFSAPGNKVRSQLTIKEEANDQDPTPQSSQPPVSFSHVKTLASLPLMCGICRLSLSAQRCFCKRERWQGHHAPLSSRMFFCGHLRTHNDYQSNWATSDSGVGCWH